MLTSKTSKALLASLVAAASLTSGALASPRDSFTLTNINSDSPAITQTRTVTASYQVQKIRIEGTLFKASTSTSLANEALIQAIAPNGMSFTIQPFSLPSFGVVPGGQALTGGTTITLPSTVSSVGSWRFRFVDTVNNSGTDARWNTVTITLLDGPPAATDLGTLSQPTTRIPDAPFHTVRWYKFTIEKGAEAAAGRYLNITTAKNTPLGATEDPSIVLYRADGSLVAFNDNGPWNKHGILSFGRIPGNFVADPFVGQNGPLAAGTYYLGISTLGATFGPDFSVRSISIAFGNHGASISTNVHTPLCPTDFNRDGVVNDADLNAYISAYVAGCFPL